jgi:lysophospholipase L1-like esterase
MAVFFIIPQLSAPTQTHHRQHRTKADIRTVEIPEYEFIDYSQNTIKVPGKDSTLLNLFFQKLDTLVEYDKGRINILHIGGSHVQAGTFPHRIRQNLDIFNGSFRPPLGLVFPYSIIPKSNTPSNYRVTYSGDWTGVRNVQKDRMTPLGMSGISVSTHDTLARISIYLNPRDERRWYFTQLRLLGYVDDGSDSVIPVIFRNSDTIPGRLETVTKSYLFDFPEPEDMFSMAFLQMDTIPHTFTVRGIIPEKETPGIVYNSIGVNGASVTSYLECEDFEKELSFLKPDLVIFGIGINDAASKDFTEDMFYWTYTILLERIKTVNPDCAFIFITNNDSFRKVSRNKYVVNSNGPVAREVFYRLAAEHQGGVWDLFSLMGGLESMKKWQTKHLAQADKVHFTREGYHLIGDMLYNAMVEYYKTK